MRCWLTSRSEGFTLVDALVGLAFVSAITAGLASLVAIAIDLTREARDDTAAGGLAVERLEQLRASFAAGTVLPVSPANTLDEDVVGYFDHVHANGETVSGPADRSWSAVFVRRWQVSSIPSGAPSARVLQVRVLLASRASSMPVGHGPPARVPGEVRLTTILAPR